MDLAEGAVDPLAPNPVINEQGSIGQHGCPGGQIGVQGGFGVGEEGDRGIRHPGLNLGIADPQAVVVPQRQRPHVDWGLGGAVEHIGHDCG